MINIFAGLSVHTDAGILFMRLALAAVFLAHGLAKQKYWKQPAGGMNTIMRILSIAEPLGGLAMLLGFLTPWAAIGLGLIMLGAIYLKKNTWKVKFAPEGSVGWEYDLVILAICVMLLIVGGGSLSLDRLWFGW